MATYIPKRKTSDRDAQEFKFPISAIEGLQDALGNSAGGTNVVVNNLIGTTWELNSDISITSSMSYSVDFTSNGKEFIGISTAITGVTAMLLYLDGTTSNVVCQLGRWPDSAFRYVTFTGGVDIANTDLIEWVNTYGKLLSVDLSNYQHKIDTRLETESKEIFGAINELNAKIGNGGEGGDTPSLIGTWTVIDEPEIPTGDLPLEFTADGVEYMAIGTTSMGSSSWGINALTYQAKEGGYYVAAYTNNPSGSYGITHGWGTEANRYITVTKEPDDKNTIKWLGKNTDAPKVEFEEDTFNGFEMPQIRFTSATGSTENETPMLYVDSDNPLKLTVEIVGGGALQVGDQLQVCIRKRFSGSKSNGFRRKYKLQRFAEYVVTENDLDRKYLTVSVACQYGSADKMLHHAHRGLFHDGMAGNIAPLYIRIRRPKGQFNSNGQTADADFSNIVTIWKHSIRGTQSIRIQ